MKLELLADNYEAHKKVARWYYDEWASLNPNASIDKVEKKLSKSINRDKAPLVVLAKESDEVIGAAELKIREMDIYPDYEFWLGGVYVEEPHRGKGIGTALTKKVMDIATKAQISEIYLQTEDLSGGLYSACGFKEIEEVDYKGHHISVMRANLRVRVADPKPQFNDKSGLYAASRPNYPIELFEYIASLVQSTDQAWDCATGNGQAAVGLSEYFSKVEATDISKEQIENAFHSEKINYSVQSAETTDFRDNQFDLVNVAQALHWFDYDMFWPEVARVLKPDGVFVAYSYIWPIINEEVDKTLVQSVTRVTEPYWASNNKILWDSYSQVKFPFDVMVSPKINIENDWDLDQFMDYIHTWSGVRRCMDDIGNDFFIEAHKALATAWGDPKQIRVVKNPLIIIAGSAGS